MSTHQVLYRKYRPHAFTEVLGQEHVVQALEGAIANKTIGHAYLFSGVRGTGKTSLARIFAHAIGTKDRDLIEIDAASNRGVDDIRALREEVHTLPFESVYKVYIIDEVHMLTKEAFNALLKTLEEPPKHVVFILATTELEKLPETILSRCQVFAFKKPSATLLKEMVLRVAGAEGYTLAPASGELIALLADGSFRDAQSILQKVLAGAQDKTVSPEEVEQATGTPQSTLLVRLVDAIGAGDLEAALKAVRAIAESTNDAKVVLTLLLRLVRAILIVRSAPSMRADLVEEYTELEMACVDRHVAESKARINSKLLAGLLGAHMRSGSTYTPELPLELALIDHLEPTN
jgi:DNA polymerase III subunit gamma/tau